jgi:hypothetical protein
MTLLYLLLGVILGIIFLALARLRRRSDWLVVAIGLPVAALAYVGFALAAGNWSWAAYELVGVFAYGVVAWCGVRGSPRWLVLGWAAHPLWDTLLHLSGPGSNIAPRSYVVSCVTFDLLVAGFVAARSRIPSLRTGSGSWTVTVVASTPWALFITLVVASARSFPSSTSLHLSLDTPPTMIITYRSSPTPTLATTGNFSSIHSTIGSFSEKIQRDRLGTAETLGVEPMRSNHAMERTADRSVIHF